MDIPLPNGFTTRVDDDDWHRLDLGAYAWYARGTAGSRRYVVAKRRDPVTKKQITIRLHRLITQTPPGLYVDHIDGDTLNNTRANLRFCTTAENQQNITGRPGTSRYKGVAWYTRYGKWRVMFNWRGRTYFVGYFADERTAALAYNAAVLPLAGAFARPNVVG